MLDDPHAGQLEALLVDLRRLGRDASGHRAADLDPVRDADREREHAAVRDDRLDQAHVAGVGAALVRDVRGEDIALAHALKAVLAQDALDLRPERAGEEREAVRLGHDLRIRVRDAAGEVEHLVDDRAHARAREHDAHLVGRRVELLLDDLDRERVEALAHRSRALRRRPAERPLAGRGDGEQARVVEAVPDEHDADRQAAGLGQRQRDRRMA